MAENIVFAPGSQFDSYIQFKNRFELYEKPENCNFVVATSKKLVDAEDFDERSVETLKYKYIRYECKFAGKPRNLAVPDEERKRNTKSFRQECPAYFTVGLNRRGDTNVLSIIKMNDSHNHTKSTNLFKVLPKQRKGTINNAMPYLEQVVHVKPSWPLLQNQVCNNDINNGVVKRRDLYNLRNHLKETPIGSNDLINIINEMKTVKGKLSFETFLH